eukprot:229380-Prymnesium_polylepis.5
MAARSSLESGKLWLFIECRTSPEAKAITKEQERLIVALGHHEQINLLVEFVKPIRHIVTGSPIGQHQWPCQLLRVRICKARSHQGVQAKTLHLAHKRSTLSPSGYGHCARHPIAQVEGGVGSAVAVPVKAAEGWARATHSNGLHAHARVQMQMWHDGSRGCADKAVHLWRLRTSPTQTQTARQDLARS